MKLSSLASTPVLVVLVVAAVLVVAVVSGPRSGTGADGDDHGELIVGTTANFDAEVLRSEVPVLLDFSATWCPPCRKLHPNLVAISNEYSGRAKVVAVDVDQDGALARKYGVSGIPALFVIVDGKQVDSSVGYKTEDQLRKFLQKHMN